jgi:hypothetical protein
MSSLARVPHERVSPSPAQAPARPQPTARTVQPGCARSLVVDDGLGFTAVNLWHRTRRRLWFADGAAQRGVAGVSSMWTGT